MQNIDTIIQSVSLEQQKGVRKHVDFPVDHTASNNIFSWCIYQVFGIVTPWLTQDSRAIKAKLLNQGYKVKICGVSGLALYGWGDGFFPCFRVTW